MQNKEAQALVEANKIRLLPCPFCGDIENKPILHWNRDKDMKNELNFSIQCSNCGCEPKHYVGTVIEAIEIWNTRQIQTECESNYLAFERCKDLMREFLNKIDLDNFS